MSSTDEAAVRWSAPVRYVEVDGQGVVFNAHYLTYCDEALASFCLARGLTSFAEDVMLKSSTLTWTGSARHGDVVDVDTSLVRLGTTSLLLRFVVSVAGEPRCTVETTYVHAPGGRASAIPDDVRDRLA